MKLTRTKAFIVIAIVAILASVPALVSAQGDTPHTILGTAYIDGAACPALEHLYERLFENRVIEVSEWKCLPRKSALFGASINSSAGNGAIGYAGRTITFQVRGLDASETLTWASSQETTASSGLIVSTTPSHQHPASDQYSPAREYAPAGVHSGAHHYHWPSRPSGTARTNRRPWRHRPSGRRGRRGRPGRDGYPGWNWRSGRTRLLGPNRGTGPARTRGSQRRSGPTGLHRSDRAAGTYRSNWTLRATGSLRTSGQSGQLYDRHHCPVDIAARSAGSYRTMGLGAAVWVDDRPSR